MECLSPITVKHGGESHRVPCSRCAMCLQTKRQSWLFRLTHESRNQMMPAFFLTLTYNEKHVPRLKGKRTLYFRHVQLFFKRLRKSGALLKYVAVGEYGTLTGRPHYHVILWTTASTELISQKWHYGNVHFGTLTNASILYTLKYIIQPKQGDNETRQKTRAQFSKGLGISYMTTALYEWHNPDGTLENAKFYSIIDGKKVPLPRYYRTKIFHNWLQKEHGKEVYYESIKRKRKELRRLRKFHKHPLQYYKELRINAAKSISTKVNFNQTL